MSQIDISKRTNIYGYSLERTELASVSKGFASMKNPHKELQYYKGFFKGFTKLTCEILLITLHAGIVTRFGCYGNSFEKSSNSMDKPNRLTNSVMKYLFCYTFFVCEPFVNKRHNSQTGVIFCITDIRYREMTEYNYNAIISLTDSAVAVGKYYI